jgi:RNA polymerase sigma-70 factor (ECF subfamily)
MDTNVHPASPASIAASPDGGPPDSKPGGCDLDLEQAVGVFTAQRPHLFAIAHKILGSASEAEDVVQETWLRWQRTDRRAVTNPPGFLATAASRLAINVLQSARTRHETAVTPWLENMADPTGGTESTVEVAEAVEMALHVLLERLSPAERAAYVLRKGFDYPYSKVAALLMLSAPNARQLVSRAHARLHSDVRRPVCLDTRRRLARAFAAAARVGEFAELEALLAADVRPAAA